MPFVGKSFIFMLIVVLFASILAHQLVVRAYDAYSFVGVEEGEL